MVRRHGFTLIELLVVVSIMAILMGLLIVVIPQMKRMASQTVTNQRLQQVLQGLSLYGQDRGACAALQDACGLGGVVRFADLTTVGTLVGDPLLRTSVGPPPIKVVRGVYNSDNETEQVGATQKVSIARNLVEVMPPKSMIGTTNTTWFLNHWRQRWPDPVIPSASTPISILPFPWGKAPLRLDGSPADPLAAAGSDTDRSMAEQAFALGAPVKVKNLGARSPNGTGQTAEFTDWSVLRSDGTSVTVDSNKPMPFDAGMLSPIKTIALLQAAGILEVDDSEGRGPAAYRSDRSKDKPWNDHWGNPLIVSVALFQPERYRRDADDFNRRDQFLKVAKEVYGYNRSLYAMVAATGPSPVAGISQAWVDSDDGTELINRWTQIRDVCKVIEWTENSWGKPAWKDVRVKVRGAERCMVTAPLEIQ